MSLSRVPSEKGDAVPLGSLARWIVRGRRISRCVAAGGSSALRRNARRGDQSLAQQPPISLQRGPSQVPEGAKIGPWNQRRLREGERADCVVRGTGGHSNWNSPMATKIQEIEAALAARFRGADIELRRAKNGRIRGSVIWDGFQGLPQIDRQVALGNALDEGVSEEQRSQVSMILTMTPDEAVSIARG